MSPTTVPPVTVAMVAPAADEVSARIAALFAEHARTVQVLSAHAAAIHDEFIEAMNAGTDRVDAPGPPAPRSVCSTRPMHPPRRRWGASGTATAMADSVAPAAMPPATATMARKMGSVVEVRNGTAVSGDVKLYYHDMGDLDDPPVLLILWPGRPVAAAADRILRNARHTRSACHSL